MGRIPRVSRKEIWQGGALELDDAVILDGDALMQQKKFRQLFFAISCMLDTSLAGDRWGTAERWGGVLSTALGRVPLTCAPGTFGMDTRKGKERGERAHTQKHIRTQPKRQQGH